MISITIWGIFCVWMVLLLELCAVDLVNRFCFALSFHNWTIESTCRLFRCVCMCGSARIRGHSKVNYQLVFCRRCFVHSKYILHAHMRTLYVDSGCRHCRNLFLALPTCFASHLHIWFGENCQYNCKTFPVWWHFDRWMVNLRIGTRIKNATSRIDRMPKWCFARWEH